MVDVLATQVNHNVDAFEVVELIGRCRVVFVRQVHDQQCRFGAAKPIVACPGLVNGGIDGG